MKLLYPAAACLGSALALKSPVGKDFNNLNFQGFYEDETRMHWLPDIRTFVISTVVVDGACTYHQPHIHNFKIFKHPIAVAPIRDYGENLISRSWAAGCDTVHHQHEEEYVISDPGLLSYNFQHVGDRCISLTHVDVDLKEFHSLWVGTNQYCAYVNFVNDNTKHMVDEISGTEFFVSSDRKALTLNDQPEGDFYFGAVRVQGYSKSGCSAKVFEHTSPENLDWLTVTNDKNDRAIQSVRITRMNDGDDGASATTKCINISDLVASGKSDAKYKSNKAKFTFKQENPFVPTRFQVETKKSSKITHYNLVTDCDNPENTILSPYMPPEIYANKIWNDANADDVQIVRVLDYDYQLGDVFGRHGAGDGQNLDFNDFNLPLWGPNSILDNGVKMLARFEDGQSQCIEL